MCPDVDIFKCECILFVEGYIGLSEGVFMVVGLGLILDW